MIITKEFYFRGWLPAGLVINARLLSDSPADGAPVVRPVINSSPGSSWPGYQPRPVFPIPQATSTSAIILKDPLPESTLAFLPLGDWYGPGTPYMLAVNTWYDGRIQSISGGDVPSVRLILSTIQLYMRSEESDPGLLPNTCVGSMPACILPGVNRQSALFIDEARVTMAQHVFGTPPAVTMQSQEEFARYMDYLLIKPYHTAGLPAGVPKGGEPDAFAYYLGCNLVAGQVTKPEGAGDIKYYGIVPVCKEDVQPIFFATSVGVQGAAFMEPVNLLKPMDPMALAVVNTTGDDQLIHYN